MKKSSKKIELASIATIAALVMTACSSGPDVVADCVERTPQPDGTHRIVADENCDRGHSAFYYIYGGSSHGGYVRGGTTIRPSNANISTRSGTVISRGGFGGGGRGGSGG
ncbi:hypothetical protein [Nonomuraea sp. SYSU D8015]|uniref:hypothetical protein n=1 Tax=Nonomuraea sp. SYSU D8015 TaxID=2593644 RepID=UPI001660FFE8|nr:hypothetical protein [Nonomuraea sp. SYSU D8015]